MINMDNFKVNYSIENKDHIIAYTFGWDKRYWLKFADKFDDVAEMLLKCNEDVKAIKVKLNRMMWIAETLVGKWLWVTEKRDNLLDTMFIVELQMYMVTQGVFTHNKKLFKRLKTNDLTRKLFEND